MPSFIIYHDKNGDVLIGSDGVSTGVMQINERVSDERCPGLNISMLDDNINCGIKMIKENYNNYKDGIPERTLRVYCKDPEYVKKLKILDMIYFGLQLGKKSKYKIKKNGKAIL